MHLSHVPEPVSTSVNRPAAQSREMPSAQRALGFVGYGYRCAVVPPEVKGSPKVAATNSILTKVLLMESPDQRVWYYAASELEWLFAVITPRLRDGPLQIDWAVREAPRTIDTPAGYILMAYTPSPPPSAGRWDDLWLQ